MSVHAIGEMLARHIDAGAATDVVRACLAPLGAEYL